MTEYTDVELVPLTDEQSVKKTKSVSLLIERDSSTKNYSIAVVQSSIDYLNRSNYLYLEHLFLLKFSLRFLGFTQHFSGRITWKYSIWIERRSH